MLPEPLFVITKRITAAEMCVTAAAVAPLNAVYHE